MLSPTILAIATVTPPHRHDTDAIITVAEAWLNAKDETFRIKALKIFRQAEVDQRYTILPLADIFRPMSLDEKNAIYREMIVNYAETALRDALTEASLAATDIDCLITTSCTGLMTPSLDAFLVNRLAMKSSVQRLPVTEMGCIGGAVGLMYAENYCRAYPDRYVALICAELTSITFQRDDFSWANVVSTAIFGDGIACAILGPKRENLPRLVRSRMHHFPDTTHLLGFDLSSTGLRMVLDERLPAHLKGRFQEFTKPVLTDAGWLLGDIDSFLVHPGGKKILHDMDMLLKPLGKTTAESRDILKHYGNMSSATLLFILKNKMQQHPEKGTRAMVLGFGPGLTAATLLLEW